MQLRELKAVMPPAALENSDMFLRLKAVKTVEFQIFFLGCCHIQLLQVLTPLVGSAAI